MFRTTMRTAYVALTLLAIGLLPGRAFSDVIVSEDFEGYANTAAMQVNWGTGAGTLDTAFGNGGQSAYHPGGTVNQWIGSSFSIKPSATQTIILTADIYDDRNRRK